MAGRPALALAAVVAITAFYVYFRTLAPTVTLVDSGELVLAAQDLGVAHPPGTPLYVLLAHLATLLPWGSVAARVAGASAVFAALAAGLVVLVVREALLAVFAPSGKAGDSSGVGAWAAFVPPAVPALCFAFSRSLWSYATVAEVYTLNALLILGVLFLLLRWSRLGGDRWLYGAAALFGLATGVHHVTVLLTLPALAVLVSRASGADFLESRRLWIAAAVATAALIAVYAYLPLAAAHRPVFAWGNPLTLERIVWHVTGRQYQSYFEASSEALAREVGAFLRMAARQFGPPWLPLLLVLAFLGSLHLWRRDRKMALALTLLLAVNLAFGVTYVIGEDKDAYYLPSYLALCLAAGFGAQAVLAQVGRRAYVAAVLALLPALPLAANAAYADRSRYFIAEDYVANALAGVAPGGMLLTGDWQLYAPLLYFREVEARRRDVVSMDIQLLRRSWYFDYLERQYPRTMAATRPQVDAFVEDLVAWEHDPGLYARSPDLTRRISGRFGAMLEAFVDTHEGTVYATRDAVLPGLAPDPEVPRALAKGRTLVPHGLVFELARDPSGRTPQVVRLETRGLFDGSIRFEADDVVSLKVKPTYLAMIASRGAYLEAAGDHAGAAAAFEEALAKDPGFVPAREALERARRAVAPAR